MTILSTQNRRMSLKSLQTKSMENLPAEVIQEIFSRLPITSLFENRYVCQTWHGLINDRRLSFMHYVQASRRINPTTSLILYNGPGLYYIPDFNTCQNVVVFNNLPFKSWLPYFKVVASQNGFICVAADGCSYRNIFICNPVIGEWFLVPRSETLYGTNYGFGYELETNEYKIVRMRFCKDEDNYDVEIHKLGTSTWRDIGKVKRIIGDDPGASGVLVSGCLHWLGIVNSTNKPSIIIVNLAEEKLSDILPVPIERCLGKIDQHFRLVDLAGRLGVVDDGRDGHVNVWVVKEYGIWESWIKHCNISVPLNLLPPDDVPKRFRPLLIQENGEILVEINNGALVSYNQKRKSYREIIINGLPGSFKAVPHVGTLLPLMHAIQTVDCGN